MKSSRQPAIGAEEERSLFRRYSALRTEADEPALSSHERSKRVRAVESHRNGIAGHYVPFVASLARRRARSDDEADDFTQAGALGLLRAIDLFDAERGTRFLTFAVHQIRVHQARSAADRSVVRVPLHIRQALTRIARASQRHQARNGCGPTDDELVELTRSKPKKLADLALVNLTGTVSLDEPVPGFDDGSSRIELVPPDADAPDARLERARTDARVRALLATLTEREQTIVRARFGLTGGEEQKLEDIGAPLNLSRERVRQVLNVALERMLPDATASFR